MNMLAILQNMWDPCRSEALNVFKINRLNHTGRKLYRITEGHDLWCTNSSSKCAPRADIKLPPDIQFLLRAMSRRQWDLYLVCGAQAKDTFHHVLRLCPDTKARVELAPVVFLPHPAARNFTNRLLEGIKRHLLHPDCAWVEFKQYKTHYRKSEYGHHRASR